ncbi:hypothetical protein LCGC14_0591970 [marine sediment metagenome]|uniref:Uncharacterized protein n=1 Tax=marine sediment metagenome TaxID=412755 RepID=A0A0F9TZD9_9ZZZZ
MRKLIACLLFLTFINVVFVQAEFKFEVTQEMKNKEAEITITGKTFDEVWKATTRTLISQKFQIKESDKESGTIFAQKRRSVFYDVEDVSSAWNFVLESDEEEIIVFCVYNTGTANLLSTGKKPFKKFREKLKERLSE